MAEAVGRGLVSAIAALRKKGGGKWRAGSDAPYGGTVISETAAVEAIHESHARNRLTPLRPSPGEAAALAAGRAMRSPALQD